MLTIKTIFNILHTVDFLIIFEKQWSGCENV